MDSKEYKKLWYQKNKQRILDERKKYYDDNKDKILTQQKNYKEKNKDKIIDYQKTEVRKKSNRVAKWKITGVKIDDFDALYERFINTKFCELCSVELTEDKRTKKTTRCLDHCHVSGLVRNIVCHSCNVKLPRQ